MIDSRILGERLRQMRTLMGMTQKQLAAAVGQTQTAISRLENGEEVYASVLVATLHFYQNKICLDHLFSSDFSAAEEYRLEEQRKSLFRQLDVITDIIRESNEACLTQLERIKKNIT